VVTDEDDGVPSAQVARQGSSESNRWPPFAEVIKEESSVGRLRAADYHNMSEFRLQTVIEVLGLTNREGSLIVDVGDLPALAAVPIDEDDETIMAVDAALAPDGIPYLDEGDETWLTTPEKLKIHNRYGDTGAESYNCLPERDQDKSAAQVAGWIHWDVNDVFLLHEAGHTHDEVRCKCSGKVYGDWGIEKFRISTVWQEFRHFGNEDCRRYQSLIAGHKNNLTYHQLRVQLSSQGAGLVSILLAHASRPLLAPCVWHPWRGVRNLMVPRYHFIEFQSLCEHLRSGGIALGKELSRAHRIYACGLVAEAEMRYSTLTIQELTVAPRSAVSCWH
jgi:hypothetical protein